MTQKQELFLRSLEIAVQIKGPLGNIKKSPNDDGTPKSELEKYLPLAKTIQESILMGDKAPRATGNTKTRAKKQSVPSNKKLAEKGLNA